MILSYISANALLNALNTGADHASVSLDLGISYTDVSVGKEGVLWPDGNGLKWETVKQITQNENACFAVTQDGGIDKIQQFSEEYNRLYSLMPIAERPQKKSAQRKLASATGSGSINETACEPERETAPTMLISGISMHRIKETTPQRDTTEKIRAAGPIRGDVLDTATGLGYTAIAAAQTADSVTTIELDPTGLEICRQNPWSQPLFDKTKITQKIGDSFDVVEMLPENSFDVIIHDPPMFNMAGHLYSADFYEELLRVLRPKGKLFHYIGNPDSKSGRIVTKGVIKRINDSGFVRVRPQPRAFGVTAHKQ